jgi:copper chaperone NosL
MKPALTRRELLMAAGAVAILTACGERPVGGAGAAPITPGVDECAWCRMLIDEERLAAQFRPARGAVSRFGEVGCLVAWLAADSGRAGTALVKTLDTAEWIPAERASYLLGAARTPMGFDITAHASPEVPGSATLIGSWDELLRRGAPDARTA